MAKVRLPTSEEGDNADKAYCLVVGQVSVLWAKIHEDLAQFYIHRLGANHWQAEVAWYSHRNDSSQRDMLKRTVEQGHIVGAENFPMARDDLLWSLDRITSLAKTRNDGIHAAVYIIWKEQGPTYSTGWWSRDPRLKKLQGVDLIKDLTACRQDLEKLLTFNRMMNSCLFSPGAGLEWPSRPILASFGIDKQTSTKT